MSALPFSPACRRQSDPHLSPPGFEHVRRFWDPRQQMMAVRVLPGEFYVSDHHEVISTVLGSCISACVHDAARGLGGINHFMLPQPCGGDEGWSATAGRAARYGSVAMEQLINAALSAGGRREDLQLKVFGGARVLAGVSDVGQRNIEFVQRYIATENLTLSAIDLGDVYPRQLLFFPRTGKAFVRQLRRREDARLVAQETQYLKQLANDPIKGEVELF